ncbi:DUF1549 domain-containing protein [Prosthecobacter sp.]|uniref:DUF1549 domain-containing protein n=1 Tax=Prosthecobacter sp. TaxID=1965333 RepID=UPI00248822E3|nr:DUF1549 domain-containing protein [Prosthecobacter sp.]MDI1310814.1 DUF1549 domain-containing protein [Prosthecobacter sp.]
MKRCLPLCALLLVCTPEIQAQMNASPTAESATAQEAAERIDRGLMHDYRLTSEKRVNYQRNPALPELPAVADDTTFLRRACIDLAGRLPRPDEVLEFIADSSPDKRAKLTDALTREPGAAEVRFRMLAEAFRVRDYDFKTIAWLRQATAEDRPYTEIVAAMIGSWRKPSIDEGNAMRAAVETFYTVLGEDLYCAMCHDHPFNDYTEHNCYALAACFTGQKEMRVPLDYKYPDAKPGEVIQPALPRLGGGWLRDDRDKLMQVVQWITEDDQSKRFALVAALRVWSGMFGMPGQEADITVGGVDDAPPWHGIKGGENPQHYHRSCFSGSPRGAATWIDLTINARDDFSQAPKLLIEEFLHCGGRLGEFQRILARTEAYSRSGIDYTWKWRDCYLAPAPQIRRLPSEVIWKTLTGENDAQLPQVPQSGHVLRMLGRGTREWTDESRTPLSHELVRFMMNGELVAQTTAKAGNAEGMFLGLLGREPSDNERAAILRTAASDQDVAWALLNTTEFMFRP